MTEFQIQQNILLAASQIPGVRVWRNNTGTARSADGNRFVRFGIPGQADISGIIQGGRRLEIEVKSATGRQSKEQKLFQAMIEKHGGLYVLARSVEEAIAGIKSALKGETA